MTNYGGPAFPGYEWVSPKDSAPGYVCSPGMTLRDYFAAAALRASIDYDLPLENDPHLTPAGIAKVAYLIADAMIAARDSAIEPSA